MILNMFGTIRDIAGTVLITICASPIIVEMLLILFFVSPILVGIPPMIVCVSRIIFRMLPNIVGMPSIHAGASSIIAIRSSNIVGRVLHLFYDIWK
jgi:hypothetical protein